MEKWVRDKNCEGAAIVLVAVGAASGYRWTGQPLSIPNALALSAVSCAKLANAMVADGRT
jgi:hypothetical protein